MEMAMEIICSWAKEEVEKLLKAALDEVDGLEKSTRQHTY